MINFKLRSGVWLVSVLVSSCSPHLTQAAGQGCCAAGRRGQLPPGQPRSRQMVTCFLLLLLHATRNMLLLSRLEFFTGGRQRVGITGTWREGKYTVTTKVNKMLTPLPFSFLAL
ncbi:hypothetical protein E2C01_029811 [Portunus trituberculatus]|uniref:Secreted protein n=1 Tax=Portunus trituberculatus TaxID=210409 RepID=A0A5B7ESG4_PORTR|nr:hypothetical protein [Portunus trituberculatus]